MVGGRPARRALAGFLAAGALCSAFGVAAIGVVAIGAGAAATHRAGVIVDTGSGTHIVVVSFPEDSITGLDLLQRAGADPVVRSFTGQGGGVCALYGVGHTADSSCLGSNDDPRYWGYFLAHGGATSWTYARAGAGSVTVHDGDVDGWRYGNGDSPSFRSFAQLTGTVSPTTVGATTTVASAAAGTTAVPGSTAPPTVLVQGTHVTAAATSAPPTPGMSTRVTTTTRPRSATASKSSNRSTSSTTSATTSSPPIADATSTTIPTTTSSRKSATEQVAAGAVRTGRRGTGSSGSAAALIGFVVVLGGLGTAIVMTRRARNRAKRLT